MNNILSPLIAIVLVSHAAAAMPASYLVTYTLAPALTPMISSAKPATPSQLAAPVALAPSAAPASPAATAQLQGSADQIQHAVQGSDLNTALAVSGVAFDGSAANGGASAQGTGTSPVAETADAAPRASDRQLTVLRLVAADMGRNLKKTEPWTHPDPYINASGRGTITHELELDASGTIMTLKRSLNREDNVQGTAWTSVVKSGKSLSIAMETGMIKDARTDYAVLNGKKTGPTSLSDVVARKLLTEEISFWAKIWAMQ